MAPWEKSILPNFVNFPLVLVFSNCNQMHVDPNLSVVDGSNVAFFVMGDAECSYSIRTGPPKLIGGGGGVIGNVRLTA